MKILTNIQTSQLGGIGQTLNNLVNFLQKDKSSQIQIIGVDVTSEINSSPNGISYQNIDNSILRFIPLSVNCPYFGDIIKTSKTVDEIKDNYSELINKFIELIKIEKPDLILLNGTYCVPWSLFQAGRQQKIPMVLHYHGILSKETDHYQQPIKNIIHDMENTFDNDDLLYIFPSKIAKSTVEKEIFKHKICRSVVIPNPIPDHFFNTKDSNSKNNIAYVGRWSNIKNPNFIKKIIKYSQDKNVEYKFNIVSDIAKATEELSDFTNDVKLYSPMNSQKLANFYSKMSIVISPSFFETYGNVAQESIASGTPALVGPNMGVAEIFKEIGLSNWIVDFKSTKNVYYKIKRFSGQPIKNKVKKMLKYNLNTNTINSLLVKTLKSA